MQPAPIPVNASARLAALKRYNVRDTPAEAEFDGFHPAGFADLRPPIALIIESVPGAGAPCFFMLEHAQGFSSVRRHQKDIEAGKIE
jgi:aspartate oxidase